MTKGHVFQRYGRTFHSDRLQPTCRQVVSKADALETEVVSVSCVDIQTVQDGIVIIKRIFLRPVAAVDELGDVPSGLSGVQRFRMSRFVFRPRS